MDTINLIENYHILTSEINTISEALGKKHSNQMQCKAGCSSCCESISVFEVEFDAIQKQIKEKQIKLPKRSVLERFTKSCRFLAHNKCTIYEFRPIICRTQGLPILYRSTTNNDYELSVCKLNFNGVRPEFFNDTNALMLSPLNTRLLLLNQAYLKTINPQNKNLNKRRNLYELE